MEEIPALLLLIFPRYHILRYSNTCLLFFLQKPPDRMGRARLLRVAAPVITEPLAKIINLCISKRVCPTSWKLAKVMPVFEVGDHLTVGNYKPISIPPVMSTISERHVHLALYEYLNQYVLLFKYQTGFRPFYSCKTAIIELVEGLLMNVDNGLLTALSLIDFRKNLTSLTMGTC